MGLYQDRVLPLLIDLSMRNKQLRPYRERVIAAAEGQILEIGIGSGLNLPYYGAKAEMIVGLDPSARLLAYARRNARSVGVPVKFLQGSAESVPLEDHSVDTVVMTWTACSIPDVRAALGELRRVLKPSGRLLFAEHGRAPEPRVQLWQDRLNPLWRMFAGGCHLNRKIDDLIEQGGFGLEGLETGYIPGPKLMTFLYEGSARPR